MCLSLVSLSLSLFLCPQHKVTLTEHLCADADASLGLLRMATRGRFLSSPPSLHHAAALAALPAAPGGGPAGTYFLAPWVGAGVGDGFDGSFASAGLAEPVRGQGRGEEGS